MGKGATPGLRARHTLWVENRRNCERLRATCLKLRCEEDPTTVIRELVDLAQEASGTTLQPGPFPPKPRKG